jgi:hypothetical protein
MTQPNPDAMVPHMKFIVCMLASALFCSVSYAIQFEVRGYGTIFSVETSIQKGEKISQMTRLILTHAKEAHLIENFSFNGLGVESITPIGQPSLGFFLEELNDKELRAYGWCYSVDGITPDLLADEYILGGAESKITWYFGYASRVLGHWISQCEPVSMP